MVFNLHKFLIYVSAKFNWKLICASCYLYLLTGNLNQNTYSGTFSDVNHELKVKTVRNQKFSLIFHN